MRTWRRCEAYSTQRGDRGDQDRSAANRRRRSVPRAEARMILVVSGGEAYAPAPLGTASVLALNGTIARIGEVNSQALAALDVEVDILDASDCFVVPGLID